MSVKTTDENGQVVWENLSPETYTVTEIETVDGQELLAEPIVIEGPTKLTPQQMTEHNVDKSKAVYVASENMYYIFEFTYDVTNSPTFTMPMAGIMDSFGKFLPLAVGMAALAVFAVVGYPMLVGKKKKRK